MSLSATRPTRHWLASSLGRLLDDPGALDAIPADLNDHDAWREASALLDWSPDQVAQALAERFRLERADMENRDPEAAKLLPEAVCKKHQMIAVAHTDRTLMVATSNPLDMEGEQEAGFLTGRSAVFQVATPDEIREALTPRTAEAMQDALDDVSHAFLDTIRVVATDVEEEVTEREVKTTPVIRLTNLILQRAVEEGATDIHMEPERDGGRVRFRVDGVLQPFMTLPLGALIRVVARVKILSEMDIADRIRPQDGRMRIEISGKPFDLRISTVPVRKQEKVVIRILDPSATFSIGGLSLDESDEEDLKGLLGHRTGIVLVTGPTGSGKTTTLYGALTELSSAELNISTVEHPVEYELRGITQIQVEPKKGVTFASALRALLRQDPDVILVGEIRDQETAEIAANASMTGHQVLSTLHTNDAAGAIPRLAELGLEPSVIASTVRGVVAQRLLRRLCPECAREVRSDWDLSEEERALSERLGVKPSHFAPGCEDCSQTGYRGRIPILEVLQVDRAISAAISRGAAEPELRQLMESQGMRSLWDSGVRRVEEGLTSLAEIQRVLGEIRELQRGTAESQPPGAMAGSRPETALATPAVDGDEASWAGHPSTNGAALSTDGGGADRVLVVEDDTGTRTLLRATLAKAGYDVFEARDGEEALNLLGEPDSEIDLVTLDLNMPKVDGLQVLEVMRSEPSMLHIPVVVATHSDDEASEMKLLGAGADDYMVKPIQPGRLLGRVQAVLRRHRLRMTGEVA